MQSSGDGESAQSEVGVQPGAKRNALEAVEGQALKAYVTAPPEGGKANDALVALLAKALGVARGRIRIVRGHRGRKRLVRIEGLTEPEARRRLAESERSVGRR
jgi:uncharacterized protein (TIGR00251 family)